MSAFLAGSSFDDCDLIEAQITTFCTVTIDGRLKKQFFADQKERQSTAEAAMDASPPSPPEYIRWKWMREQCYSIIRGKHTPLFFKLVFFYPRQKQEAFIRSAAPQTDPDGITGLCLNLRFDGTVLLLTTGVSFRAFTPDRSLEHAWDEAVRRLLSSMDIQFEEG